jgi:hypothetical protein
MIEMLGFGSEVPCAGAIMRSPTQPIVFNQKSMDLHSVLT